MKKVFIVIVTFFIGAIFCVSAFAFEKKEKFTLGITPLSKSTGEDLDFSSAYLLSDIALSNDYITVGGKIYYRLSKSDDSSDAGKTKLFRKN